MRVSLLRQTSLPFDCGELPWSASSSEPRPHTGGAPSASAAPPTPTLPTEPLVVPAAPGVPVVAVGPGEIEYVRHARARRYLLRVRVDGTVRATIPRGGSKREAVRFVESQLAWIAEQRRVALRVRAARRPPMPSGELQTLMRRAAESLRPRLHALAAQFGLRVARVSIRNQRRRWGSCSRQAHICLNWRLMQMPDWVRDYVLIHELMHLRRMDHSPAFWKHVAVACPDYQRARAWLREHGHGLTDD